MWREKLSTYWLWMGICLAGFNIGLNLLISQTVVGYFLRCLFDLACVAAGMGIGELLFRFKHRRRGRNTN